MKKNVTLMSQSQVVEYCTELQEAVIPLEERVEKLAALVVQGEASLEAAHAHIEELEAACQDGAVPVKKKATK